MQKILNRVEDDEESDLNFDPVDLRAKRQAALATAMIQPIFKEANDTVQKDVHNTEQYPFVFDSHSRAKASAGKIQCVNTQSLV